MELSRTQSTRLGHIALHDSTGDQATSGNVGDDGRFRVQFHNSPQTLTRWLHRYEAEFCGRGRHAPKLQKQRSRRQSSVAFLDKTKATNPRLSIAIHIVGSRGDVQPFIPIAQLLMRPPYGHRVRICTHPVFKDFVESNGIEFFSIGGDPEALMAYMVRNPGLLPSLQSLKAGDVGKRRSEMAEIINKGWRSCIEAGNGMEGPQKAAHTQDPKDLFIADAIIANPPSMSHIHCAEKLGIPLHMVFTMPWSPTQNFHHPLAAMDYGKADTSVANYLSFMIMELLTWQGLGDLINKFRQKTLGLDPISSLWGYQLIPRLRVPYTYLWSQTLIPKPPDWDDHIRITGFSFLPLGKLYKPPPDLTEFLERGPAPIYIGFGSIVVDDPAALTRLILEAVKMANVRVILSKGWGGMEIEGENDDIYLIGNCPHDWLFQRVSAVVHHGGAGTTAAGIAAGRPTVIVPFFGDQLFWGQMISRAGAGPEPVPFSRLTAGSLANNILFALRPETQAAVARMAEQIADEDGAGDASQLIHERLDIDEMRCDVCPERIANWKHKASGAQLSGFAVACLVDREVIRPHEVKLLRQKHWYVDEGAEHPLIGAVASFSGLATDVATATADFSTRLKAKVLEDADMAKDTEMQALPPSDVQHDRTESLTANAHDGALKHVFRQNSLLPNEMELVARKMATKSLRNVDPSLLRSELLKKPNTTKKDRQHRGRHRKLRHVMRASGRYASDVTVAGLKAPVSFFYNIANGFHNYPSYGTGGREVRRRDEITGLGSGLRTAGKEFVLGFWDAFSGLIEKPYLGTKEEGPKGLAKGVWAGGRDFVNNIGASSFGLLGYSLKGVEKECSKHHLTGLKAEIVLIRLRQGIDEFRTSSVDARAQVIKRWEIVLSEKRVHKRQCDTGRASAS